MGGLGLGIALGSWVAGRSADATSTIRFPLEFGEGLRLRWPFSPVTLSPDGGVLALIATDDAGPPRIFVRAMNETVVRELPGTDNAEQLFFSPDGRWIGFYTGLALRKVRVGGGAPISITDVPEMRGASWTHNDEIVVSSEGRLAVVPANGGMLRSISSPDSAAGEMTQVLPLVLEDGTIIYTARGRYLEHSRIAVASLRGGAPRILELPGTTPLGVIDGHLLYMSARSPTYSRNAITAVAFDQRRGVATGSPTSVIDSVAMNAWGDAGASLSRSGSLVYIFRGDYRSRLVLRGVDGSSRVVTPDVRYYLHPRFSPDGSRIAVEVASETSTERHVHILDLASGTLTQLSGMPSANPEWSADGARILFSSRGELWMRKADLSGPEELLFRAASLRISAGLIGAGEQGVMEGVLSPDGQALVARVNLPDGNRELWYRRLVGDTSVQSLAFTQVEEFGPRISPDGHWVAYRSGSPRVGQEIYISPLPGPGPRHQLTKGGGGMPVWSRDGRRLYYVQDRRLMAVTISWSPNFAIVSRDTVLTDRLDGRNLFHANYDVSPDGRSFLLNEMVAAPRVVFVHDWRQELRQRVAIAR